MFLARKLKAKWKLSSYKKNVAYNYNSDDENFLNSSVKLYYF